MRAVPLAAIGATLVAVAAATAPGPARGTTLDCSPDTGGDARLGWAFSLEQVSGDRFAVASRFGPPLALRLQVGDAATASVFVLTGGTGHVGLLTILPDGRYMMTIHDPFGILDTEVHTGSGTCRSFER